MFAPTVHVGQAFVAAKRRNVKLLATYKRVNKQAHFKMGRRGCWRIGQAAANVGVTSRWRRLARHRQFQW